MWISKATWTLHHSRELAPINTCVLKVTGLLLKWLFAVFLALSVYQSVYFSGHSGSGVFQKHIPGRRSVIVCLVKVREYKKRLVQVYNITEIDHTSWKGCDSIMESHGKFIRGLDPTTLNMSRSPRWIPPLTRTCQCTCLSSFRSGPRRPWKRYWHIFQSFQIFFLPVFGSSSFSTFPISLPTE